jgi:glyoxylate reductase
LKQQKVFLTRKITPSAIDRISAEALLEMWQNTEPPTYETLLSKCKGIAGLLCLLTDKIDENLIRSCLPGLKVISQMAVGTDNIDLAAATKLGIPVGNTPAVLTEATADHTFTLLMATARRIVEADREVHAGIWRAWGPDVLCGNEVSGSTLGIIGFGRIGQAVARRATGFDMKVLYSDHHRNYELEREWGVIYTGMEDLIARSDFITLHVFLNQENYHLFGKKEFGRMKKTAILVNTSRGSVVDPKALAWALENHRIAAAALDVTEPEPIEKDNPLLKYPNLVITPHIASATTQTREKMANVAVDNLLAGLRGERLPFCANPAVYKSIKQ